MPDNNVADCSELLLAVAHAAWHVCDDAEVDTNEHHDCLVTALDYQKLSDALDALEAAGWDAHPEDRPASSARLTHTLHGCKVETFDGNTFDPERCGDPAHRWTAPNGRQHFVCAAHRALFEATGDSDLGAWP